MLGTILVVLFLIVLVIVLSTSGGFFLTAGFNTFSKGEKEKYNRHRDICNYLGRYRK